MCGIAGIVGREPSSQVLEAMVSSLAHRGPDDHGIWEGAVPGSWVGLGATRLAILDLAPTGHQPMVDHSSGTVIAFNGEVYNFRELREEIRREGVDPGVSSGDTAVVLHAYLSWGDRFLERLRGMFACAIWDPRRRRMLIARDGLGIKPLYYSVGSGGRFAFASEVRALLKIPWVSRTIDLPGLAAYLAYGSIQDPSTLLAGVRSLEAGCFISVDLEVDGAVVRGSEVYRSFSDGRVSAASDGRRTDGEVAEDLQRVLEEAIRAHLVSDVDVGVFLSGGMDSGIVAATAARVSSRPVHTVCVGFPDSEYDESVPARRLAERCGCRHTSVILRPRDFLGEFPRWLASLDQPSTDGINVWVVSQAARRLGLKVMLSGVGGDELFTGYPSFHRVPSAVKLMGPLLLMPRSVRSRVAAIMERMPSRPLSKMAAFLLSDGSAVESYLIMRRMLLPKDCVDLLDASYAELVRGSALSPGQMDSLRKVSLGDDLVNAVSRMEIRAYMTQTLLRDADQASMAHSVELRVPFVDWDVVNHVLDIPGRFKLRRGQFKPLLGAVFRALVGEQFVPRRKQPFMFPLDIWLRNDIREPIERGLEWLCGGGLPIRSGAVRKLWTRFLAGDSRVNSSQILTLYVLADWLDRHNVI